MSFQSCGGIFEYESFFSLNSFAIRVLYNSSKRWSVNSGLRTWLVVGSWARGPVGPWARGPMVGPYMYVPR